MSCYVEKKCEMCGSMFIDKTKSHMAKFCCANHKSKFQKIKHSKHVKEHKAEYFRINKNKIYQKHNERRRAIYKAVENGSASHEQQIEVLSIKVRNRINCAIKRGSKKSSSEDMLGCSIKELMVYLKRCPNTNEHIDHICPCSQAQNEEELIRLQHYMNLRILDKTTNLSKSDSWTPEGEEMCVKLLGRKWIHKEFCGV
jgi:hypothetical protein